MDRRDAVKRVSLLMGGVISAPALAAILDGCTPKTEPLAWQPTFFTEEQARAIADMSDIFIPKTDTAGAKELGVPKFIEEMVAKIYDNDYRGRFMNGLNEILESVKTKEGNPFHELDKEDKTKLVADLNAEAVKTLPLPDGEDRGFILLFKELMLVGYCTSEVGATEVLQYDAIPGAYNGCIPLDEAGGKTWAT